MVADRLDVVDGGHLAVEVACERRAPGDVQDNVLGEEAECRLPVIALGCGEVVRHQLAGRHAGSLA
jgi:hypothetical protein